MGLHLVALAKLHLLSPSHTPLVASLFCPFVLKLSFSSSIVRRVYFDVTDATRLFFFQLSQIVFEPDHQPAPGNAGDSRWERALRLVCQRITHARRSPAGQSDEDSLHTLTMLSL
ncbi:hypothetical protein PTKIN_Ptkin04bG0208900 [Pterospermum kingtungense]